MPRRRSSKRTSNDSLPRASIPSSGERLVWYKHALCDGYANVSEQLNSFKNGSARTPRENGLENTRFVFKLRSEAIACGIALPPSSIRTALKRMKICYRPFPTTHLMISTRSKKGERQETRPLSSTTPSTLLAALLLFRVPSRTSKIRRRRPSTKTSTPIFSLCEPKISSTNENVENVSIRIFAYYTKPGSK